MNSFAKDVRDSMTDIAEEVPLSITQKQELDLRLEAYHQNPNAGSPWSVVRERISDN